MGGPMRIDPKTLRPETRAAIMLLGEELKKEPELEHINGVQVTLDHLYHMDGPPTIDVRYV